MNQNLRGLVEDEELVIKYIKSFAILTDGLIKAVLQDFSKNIEINGV